MSSFLAAQVKSGILAGPVHRMTYRQLLISPQYVPKPLPWKTQEQEESHLCSSDVQEGGAGVACTNCVVPAVVLGRRCSPPPPRICCVPKGKLLPGGSCEPLIAKSLPFLVSDFWLSHFPEQDGTVQQCELIRSFAVSCSFTSLSSAEALILLLRGLTDSLVLCSVSLKGVLFLRVQDRRVKSGGFVFSIASHSLASWQPAC